LDTVTTTFYSDYKIKNSKFIGYLAPCTHLDELNSVLESIKNEHPTATHHCYAYRINPEKTQEFSTDDGEPGGTAGAPILNSLRSRELMNVVCVVVRYYGGNHLGKSGLISAYSHTALLAADAAVTKKIIPVQLYRVRYGYEHQSVINSLKHKFDFSEIESSYLEKVSLTIAIPAKQASSFVKHIDASVHLFDSFEKLGSSYQLAE
jgi:uncharacterized YigZ family protein